MVGLLVPLAAAAYPVFTGIAITVRAAMADSGVNPVSFGSGRLDRLICGVGGAGRPLLLGVRNSVRRRARTALTLFTLGAAGAYYISALSIRASMIATLDRRFGAGTYGADSRYAWDQHMLMIYVFLIVVSGVLAAVGSLGLMTATSLNVLDRTARARGAARDWRLAGDGWRDRRHRGGLRRGDCVGDGRPRRLADHRGRRRLSHRRDLPGRYRHRPCSGGRRGLAGHLDGSRPRLEPRTRRAGITPFNQGGCQL